MYGFHTTLKGGFDAAIQTVTEALKTEGFGVLSDIDVKQALKTKINADIAPYRILGACNPPLAHRAIEAEPDVGLLLPCNVLVRQDAPDTVYVGFLDPGVMSQLIDKPAMKAVADDARARLMRVRDKLAAG